MIDQRKQARRSNGERAITHNPLSLDAQSLSHSHANESIFRIWINLALSVKEGQMHFVILCLLSVLEDSYIVPFTFNSIPVAVRTSNLLLHRSSQSSNQQGFSPGHQRTLRDLGMDQRSGNPYSQLAEADRLHFPLAQPLAPTFCHFVPTHGLPTDIQKSASCPPLPLQPRSLLGVTLLSACHFPPVV